ncbi:MAG: response regulator transcription factor [Deinococcota bacterium]
MSGILLIEDDPDLTKIVTGYLEKNHFDVHHASDGATGLSYALERSPELVLLDWMLPELDGVEVLKRLRQQTTLPVIMITARTEEIDRVLGLELGADDYLIKPFSIRELLARIRAVLRRTQQQADVATSSTELLKHQHFVINLAKHEVTCGHETLLLTSLEFELLVTFARAQGHVFSRDLLIDKIWGRDFQGVDRVVDVHVSSLRRKLQQCCGQDVFQTLRGIGYKLLETVP